MPSPAHFFGTKRKFWDVTTRPRARAEEPGRIPARLARGVVGGEPLEGQIFNLFTLHDGKIVRIDDYRRRGEALAAAVSPKVRAGDREPGAGAGIAAAMNAD
jgi:hypothetical protein